VVAGLATVLLIVGIAVGPGASGDATTVQSTRLPNPSGRATAEPGIAAGPDGSVWVTSISSPPPTGPLAGTFPGAALWRSTNGGASFEWVPTPLDVPSAGGAQLPFNGSDVDVAVAPERQANGDVAVFLAALWPSFPLPTQITLSISRDSGKSWITTPVAAVPGDVVDRPWLVADGACSVYVFHLSGVVTPGFRPQDEVGGFGQAAWRITRVDICGPAVAVHDVAPLPSNGVQLVTLGKPAIDTGSASPFHRRLYAVAEQCHQGTGPGTPCAAGTDVVALRSHDGGATWERTVIALVPNGHRPIWGTAVAVDPAGGVDAVWHDGVHVYASRSTDGGSRWSAPVIVSGSGSAVMPTVTAPRPGVAVVSWYGTDRAGLSSDVRVMGRPGSASSARWTLHVAESVDGARTFGSIVAGPTVHFGAICTDGTACDSGIEGAENLLDDIGAAVAQDGRTLVAFTNDQPGGTMDNDHIDIATVEAGAAPVAAGAAVSAAAARGSSTPLPVTGGGALPIASPMLLLTALACRRHRRSVRSSAAT
jgi:hypothetical protein